MKQKLLLLTSFALATVLVVGQISFASGDTGMGNGMSQMMNMTNNDNMNQMMNAMNSPEGQEMVNACGKFMDSYSGEAQSEKGDL